MSTYAQYLADRAVDDAADATKPAFYKATVWRTRVVREVAYVEAAEAEVLAVLANNDMKLSRDGKLTPRRISKAIELACASNPDLTWHADDSKVTYAAHYTRHGQASRYSEGE